MGLAYWLRSQCLACCKHINFWSWLRAVFVTVSYRCWSVQILRIILAAQGDGRCQTIHTVKIAVPYSEGCCTATTMAITSIKQKESMDSLWPNWVSRYRRSRTSILNLLNVVFQYTVSVYFSIEITKISILDDISVNIGWHCPINNIWLCDSHILLAIFDI